MCGLACLRSVLLARDGSAPCMSALLDGALEQGVFVEREDGSILGMIYRPFGDMLARRHGIAARVMENASLSEMLDGRSPGAALMLSVHPSIRTPEREPPTRGGHMVLVIDHDDERVVFHNPSGVPSEHRAVVLSRSMFDRFYANRGIHLDVQLRR